MTLATSTKKPSKHHYFIHYKKGDYISTRDLLEERYESAVYGSGMFIQTGAFDIHNSIIPPEDMKKTESIISAMMEARDEARREVCELKSHNFEEKISPQSYAAMRKWDCFPDASQSQQ